MPTDVMLSFPPRHSEVEDNHWVDPQNVAAIRARRYGADAILKSGQVLSSTFSSSVLAQLFWGNDVDE